MRGWGRAWVLALAGFLMAPAAGHAQERPLVTVRVRQVAGTSLYLDVGSLHGVRAGDTLVVHRPDDETPLGRLVVTAGTERRSVLTFAGTPFPVTRGDGLVFRVLHEPQEAVADATLAGAPSTADPASVEGRVSLVPAEPTPRATRAPDRPALPSKSRRAHGRVALDLSGIRSVTQAGGADPVQSERNFATPSLRMDIRVPDAVGGFELRTSARVAYRYADGGALASSSTTRIYAASLERRFTSVPLQVMLGRFHSPAESYSGFWDGALARVGGPRYGVGALVGFEPDQWNQNPSGQRPKATVFMEGRARGEGWRWSTDLSAHTVRPRDSIPAHTFVGWSQRISLGVLDLDHDIQVDRDPWVGDWRVSRFRARASLEVAPGVELRGGVSRREPYVMGLFEAAFGRRRDRLSAGVGLRGAAGYASVDLDVGRDASGDETRGGSAFFALTRLPGLARVGVTGSASRWSGSYGTTLSLSPGLSVSLSSATLRLGFRYGSSDYLGRSVVTRGLDGSLDLPLDGGLRLSARGRVQWGGLLTSQGVDLTLSRIF